MTEFTMNKNLKMGRVVLKVKDLHRQTAFYCEVVGLSVIKKTPTTVTLGTDGETVLVELRQTADKEQPNKGTGLFHLALLVPNREAFATKFFEVLRNKETIDSPNEQAGRFPHFERILPIARLDSASDHGYSEAFYLYDLEGNGIEIYADRPRTEWDKYPAGSHPLNFKELAPLASYDTDGKLPAETVMGHVHLRIDKMEETLAFYTEALGFEKQEVYDDVFFVSAGGYHHHIAGNIWSGEGLAAPLEKHTGLEHVEVKMPSVEALEELKNHVKQQVPMQEMDNFFVVEDPSKNKIIFT
ncbi:MAG: VOC family protein, partial [Kurthia sp.]|nr:VOC family protein [Candidatus Kurthia equi]